MKWTPLAICGRGITWVLCRLIRFYQWVISPHLGPACRYQPTCSDYARQALMDYGPFKGGWLALRRILRCHPFARGGYDPVPPRAPRSE